MAASSIIRRGPKAAGIGEWDGIPAARPAHLAAHALGNYFCNFIETFPVLHRFFLFVAEQNRTEGTFVNVRKVEAKIRKYKQG